ncbi:glucosyltransferase [Pleurotus eryngii]|uniref:Dol-P-Glc:Glc(2)Man(9)GlcNAc(2)-PP-Dol alpha-1,2-glucosyltransferase n=1 Tax=Pleurotus eryngii TaxID=5323 RepID=A0A9P6A5F9_PLEER|nr:glucosyltransferase [Pleurotus eryngii]
MSVPFIAFCGLCITVLKELNHVVTEPYMDEPFHIPQAQAYCEGDFATWDPKITTPPGLYLMSVILKRIFMFKCTLPMLRLTTTFTLLALPIMLTKLLCFHQRERLPSSLLSPSVEALVLSSFPVTWFFGFLYYTEVPSVLTVTAMIVFATQGKHSLAALLGLVSCTFRQTNVVWVLYTYGISQLAELKYRKGSEKRSSLHDPPALDASLGDFSKTVMSFPSVLPEILPSFLPYAGVLAAFGAFVAWNGGIVLGDKSNHIPSLHIPQVYYFVAFSTAFGWPVLISGEGRILGLLSEVWNRMFGSVKRIVSTSLIMAAMSVTVHYFTIHHPFLLSDNRHYTFYVWRRIYMLHPAIPHLLVPVYLACAWAWFLRVGKQQTILQALLLPICVLPTLLPTPLLEPRYFLIPYILLRVQIVDTSSWGLAIEGAWYTLINAVTMYVFLYLEREGVGRFMW